MWSCESRSENSSFSCSFLTRLLGWTVSLSTLFSDTLDPSFWFLVLLSKLLDCYRVRSSDFVLVVHVMNVTYVSSHEPSCALWSAFLAALFKPHAWFASQRLDFQVSCRVFQTRLDSLRVSNQTGIPLVWFRWWCRRSTRARRLNFL